jgi:hypothetical protein
MTHRETLTGADHLIPSPIDYAADSERVSLYEPSLSARPLQLNHEEAKALLRRLAERYPAEVQAIFIEQAEARDLIAAELRTRARRRRTDRERWCSWCSSPVPQSESYTAHLARHI